MKSITLKLTFETLEIIKSIMRKNSYATGTKALNFLILSYDDMLKNERLIKSLETEVEDLKKIIQILR